ncbi:flexible cuticle protein 12-like [Aethina tumida]|uniref:flexible cuticle protein 12-like n=1 Tax=Aethina tumida TaxID=116153 RepID=UPI00096B5379|nr:flexible cuticle protein 12-like [Aethina tumida]
MKVFAVLFAVIAVSAAASLGGPDAAAEILRSELDNIGTDGFKWGYETSNGISAEESGHLINAGSENEAIAVQGSFKYVDAEGKTYTVTYIADENGFQPQGEHLPH